MSKTKQPIHCGLVTLIQLQKMVLPITLHVVSLSAEPRPPRPQPLVSPPDVITVVLGVPSHLNLIWTLMKKTQGPFSWCT